MSDTATVHGTATDGSPTGTVTFYVCQTATSQTPTAGPCPVSTASHLSIGHLTTGSADTSTTSSGAFTPTSAGTWCFSAVYASSDSYQASSDNTAANSLDPNECVLVKTAPSTTSSFISSAQVTLGPSGTVSDDADVSGSFVAGSPTGSVTFYACETATTQTLTPGPCSTTGTPEGAAQPLSTGAGDTSSATSSSFVPTSAGTWCFGVVYGGDANYSGSSDNTTAGNADPDECVLVARAQSVTMSLTSAVTVQVGSAVTDKATVMGNSVGGAPKGSVQFYTCGPGTQDALCTSTAKPSGTVSLVATGASTAAATSTAFVPGATGTYCFAAIYEPGTAGNYLGSSDNASGVVDTHECIIATAAGDSITSADHALAVVGQSFTFPVTTSVPATKIREKGKLAKGVHFAKSGGSGTFTGTAKKTGTFTVTLTATFGKGKTKQTATQVFTLSVT